VRVEGEKFMFNPRPMKETKLESAGPWGKSSREERRGLKIARWKKASSPVARVGWGGRL